MKHVLTIVILIAICGVAALLYVRGTFDGMLGGEQVPADVVAAQQTAYVPYSAEAVAEADVETIVLYFFDSSHLQSRALDASLQANVERIPDGVRVFRVPFHEHPALRLRYGVGGPNTFVAFPPEEPPRLNEVERAHQTIDEIVDARDQPNVWVGTRTFDSFLTGLNQD